MKARRFKSSLFRLTGGMVSTTSESPASEVLKEVVREKPHSSNLMFGRLGKESRMNSLGNECVHSNTYLCVSKMDVGLSVSVRSHLKELGSTPIGWKECPKCNVKDETYWKKQA